MDKNVFNLFSYILKKEITLEELSLIYGKTKRSIRNDINSINYLFYKKMGLSPIKIKKGIISTDFPEIKLKNFINSLNYYEYSLDKVERVVIIIIFSLINQDRITINSLSEFMQVSRTTIISDLKKVKEVLKLYELKLISEPSKGIYLEIDNVKNIYQLILDLVNFDINNVIRLFNQDLFIFISNLGNIKFIDYINKIKNIISVVEKSKKQYLTSNSKNILIYFLAIVLNYSKYDVKTYEVKDKDFTHCLLLQLLNNNFKLNDKNILLISRLIKSLNFKNKDYKKENILKIQFITHSFIEKISSKLNINLVEDQELLNNLSKHLTSILDNNIKKFDDFKNILEITKEYPKIIKLVRQNLGELNKFAKRDLSEMEIRFIVVYLIVAIEKLKNNVSNISILIICKEGIVTSYLIKEKIKKIISGTVQYLATFQNYKEEISKRNPDIIISNFSLDIDRKYIYIENIIEDSGFKELINLVDNLKLEKIKNSNNSKYNNRNNEFKIFQNNKLNDFLSDEFINLDIEAVDWKDAIKKASKILLNKKYIEKRYVDSMIQSINDYGPYIVISKGIAIPHAGSDDGVNKTSMSLIKLKNPIDFGVEDYSKEVKYIIVLSSINNEHFEAFFDLIQGLQDKKLKEEFMKAKTKEDLHKIFIKMEELSKK